MAEKCARTLERNKITQIVLTSLTASGVIATVFSDQFLLKIMASACAALSTFLALYQRGFDPGTTAQKHRDAASNIWNIRESYLSLLTDLSNGDISDADARVRRDMLQAELSVIYAGAPQTSSTAYLAAQKGLQRDEEFTFSDEEIDKFLPNSLRKKV